MIPIHTQITDRTPAAARPRTQQALRRLEKARSAAPDAEGIVVRMLSDSDHDAVARLAELDSATAPRDRLLGAEVDGELIAVRALDSGIALADPFHATAAALELLELRAAQLRDQGRRRRFRLPRLPRARGAIAGSPPGGASNLLQL